MTAAYVNTLHCVHTSQLTSTLPRVPVESREKTRFVLDHALPWQLSPRTLSRLCRKAFALIGQQGNGCFGRFVTSQCKSTLINRLTLGDEDLFWSHAKALTWVCISGFVALQAPKRLLILLRSSQHAGDVRRTRGVFWSMDQRLTRVVSDWSCGELGDVQAGLCWRAPWGGDLRHCVTEKFHRSKKITRRGWCLYSK